MGVSPIGAWLMWLLLVLTFRCYELSWKEALGQVTIIWLFGVSVAYRFQNKQQFLSGVSTGFASLSGQFRAATIRQISLAALVALFRLISAGLRMA